MDKDRTVLTITRMAGGFTETSFNPKEDDDFKVAAAGIYTLFQRSKYMRDLVISLLFMAETDDEAKKQMDEAVIDPSDFDNLLKNLK